MPANRITKHTGALSQPVSATVGDPKPVIPWNPLRVAITIQNTGTKPGLVRFGGPCQVNGSDLLLAAGGMKTYDQADTCPLEAVNVACQVPTDTTTWAIVETIQP